MTSIIHLHESIKWPVGYMNLELRGYVLAKGIMLAALGKCKAVKTIDQDKITRGKTIDDKRIVSQCSFIVDSLCTRQAGISQSL